MTFAISESMDDRCRGEVYDLHQFFQDWFNARIEPTDGNFDRFEGVLAPGFQIVFPNGQIIDRDALTARVRAAHGANVRSGAPIRIWIDAYRSRPIEEGLQLVTYQEWQQTVGPPRGRRATAVMRHREGRPRNVEWLHVHEVWLPDSAAALPPPEGGDAA